MLLQTSLMGNMCTLLLQLGFLPVLQRIWVCPFFHRFSIFANTVGIVGSFPFRSTLFSTSFQSLPIRMGLVVVSFLGLPFFPPIFNLCQYSWDWWQFPFKVCPFFHQFSIFANTVGIVGIDGSCLCAGLLVGIWFWRCLQFIFCLFLYQGLLHQGKQQSPNAGERDVSDNSIILVTLIKYN